MAKSKTSPPADPPVAVAKLSFTQALTETVRALGRDSKGDQIRKYLETHFPTVEYKTSTFNSTLSAVRKRLFPDNGSTGARRGRRSKSETDPAASDLIRVMNMATTKGGIAEFESQIKELLESARQVGGLDKLQACIDALKKLKP